jgi:hypothetical protein
VCEQPLAREASAPQFADESTGGVTLVTLWMTPERALNPSKRVM